MYKYITLILLLLFSVNIQANHTLSASNIEVNNIMATILNTECSITDRLYLAIEETDDIIFVVTVVCEGGNGFIQYLINVYGTVGKPIATQPIIVGTGFDFVVDDITVDGNIIQLNGKQWKDEDAHCCPTLVTTRSYILYNHKFKEDK